MSSGSPNQASFAAGQHGSRPEAPRQLLEILERTVGLPNSAGQDAAAAARLAGRLAENVFDSVVLGEYKRIDRRIGVGH